MSSSDSAAGLKKASDSTNQPTKTSFPLFDLEHQFAFYGSYHVNPVNVAIHIICVPTIFFTALILSHYFSFFASTVLSVQPITIPQWLLNTGLYGSESTYELNLATLTALGYATYFIILDPIAGSLYAPLLLSFGQWSNQLYALKTIALPGSNDLMSVYSLALGIFIAGWIAQFIGHGKFEGRAPALIDNLLQSIVLAVFFVFIEVLFKFGYRKSLQVRLKNRIGKAVLEFRRSKALSTTTTLS
ncbi:hypothetical protein CROQUDRAFT_59278 [Cronartium quercuum f. sp. fusiforme G11]|uniref:DUF962 domain-containing protein n=1 Tax=Cronartium quercuum f. sp. fusiforme G11 TaxID=708437 RepID=A0A9P6NP53_9BASI|nr:hypothetical protein CROQUDRAFT_59278 [Cronartium quercuum f. sp. fusiforme G11]